MSDFTMCASDDCSLVETCKRHAKSGTIGSNYQSMFLPKKQGEECENYWEKIK